MAAFGAFGGGARKPVTYSGAARIERETELVMRALSDVVPQAVGPPPETLFPAHLSVALVDAVFGAGESGAGSPAERYCRHFETPHLREERWDLPPVDAQVTLSAFVTRYERLGVEAMAATVFEDLTLFPGTEHVRAGYALALARGLRHLGVDTFQDLAALRPGALDAALRIESGFDARVVRSLMSYAGGDDFVWGDAAVRGFVALALGAETVSAARSEVLVRRAAYRLILSPRHVDYRIWSRACGVAR